MLIFNMDKNFQDNTPYEIPSFVVDAITVKKVINDLVVGDNLIKDISEENLNDWSK